MKNDENNFEVVSRLRLSYSAIRGKCTFEITKRCACHDIAAGPNKYFVRDFVSFYAEGKNDFFLNSNYAHFEGESCVSGAATTRWRDDWSCEGMRRTRELKMSRHGLFHPLNSFCNVLFWVLVCFCVLFFLVWFYVVVYVQKDRRVPDGSITDPSLLLIAGIFPIHRR